MSLRYCLALTWGAAFRRQLVHRPVLAPALSRRSTRVRGPNIHPFHRQPLRVLPLSRSDLVVILMLVGDDFVGAIGAIATRIDLPC
eukprot:816108-Rhodomonas_salina.5